MLPTAPLRGPLTRRGRWRAPTPPLGCPPLLDVPCPTCMRQVGPSVLGMSFCPTYSRVSGLLAKVRPKQRSPLGHFSSIMASVSPSHGPDHLSLAGLWVLSTPPPPSQAGPSQAPVQEGPCGHLTASSLCPVLIMPLLFISEQITHLRRARGSPVV